MANGVNTMNNNNNGMNTMHKDMQNGNNSNSNTAASGGKTSANSAAAAVPSNNVGVAAMSETSDDSSLNSVDLDPMMGHLDGGAAYIDSDTGLESMSSADATTKACSICLGSSSGGSGGGGSITPAPIMGSSPSNETVVVIENLRQEVTRLKCDKLDLLRQNVVSKL